MKYKINYKVDVKDLDKKYGTKSTDEILDEYRNDDDYVIDSQTMNGSNIPTEEIKEGSTTFKVGDKVTYLGYPAEITGINKEMTGDVTYNIYYDKGNGKTKASNISNKGGEIKEGELSEAYVPSNIKEFAKRKGISSLVNKVAGWAEKAGKGIRGGTAIGKDYSTLVLDMTYQGGEIRINTDNDTITLFDEPVNSFNEFQRVYIDGQDLEETVNY